MKNGFIRFKLVGITDFKMTFIMNSMSCGSLFACDIPEGTSWGDYFYDSESTSVVTIFESVSSTDWETVGAKKAPMESLSARPLRWCKHGNACLWKNCPFRHERCAHYDTWIARGKRGYNCRCHTTDPESCKSPEEGGCKYDHRDTSKLEIYHAALPCSDEAMLWDSFYERGLNWHGADAYDVSKMSRTNKALLLRSLRTAEIEFDDNDTWLEINI